MKVLVLTPVLNGSAFLDAAIWSVRAQTHADWRLVILDAGSTDGSQSIARAHAQEDDRIQLHEEPDGGMYDALRRGFERDGSGASILCWLNSDDLYTPWAFAEVAATLSAGHEWITGLPGLWDSEGRLRAVLPRGGVRREDILAGRHHDGYLGALQQESMFFARTLFDTLSLEERDIFAAQKLAGDFHLWRCFARRARLHTIPSVLGGFRVHAANRSRRFADEYRNEAEAMGAFTPSSDFLRRSMRRFTALRAAVAAAAAFERAAYQLHNELPEKVGPS